MSSKKQAFREPFTTKFGHVLGDSPASQTSAVKSGRFKKLFAHSFLKKNLSITMSSRWRRR